MTALVLKQDHVVFCPKGVLFNFSCVWNAFLNRLGNERLHVHAWIEQGCCSSLSLSPTSAFRHFVDGEPSERYPDPVPACLSQSLTKSILCLVLLQHFVDGEP